ncbi:MAG TPA: tetratricopeptide repeat protein [Pyrinomonadaceae bacterium]|nr:tetratricopeptide repeat protein [Pyrinomonadaceae bacterium]
MDSLRQARTKATTMLAGLRTVAVSLAAGSVFAAMAQQPPKSIVRTPAKTPATSTVKAPINNPLATNDVNKLLADGQAAFDAGRFDEAIARYNRVILLSANQPRTASVASLLIGNVNMAQGKFGNAEVAFQRAVTLSPNYAEAYNGLGEALGELKQFPRAIEAFNKAVGLDPKLLKAKYNQAVTYDRMRNFRYSEFVFRNLIKANPDYPLAYDGLAVTLSKAGRAKEAMALHEKAIALSPREPSYYFNYAISNLMLGNTAKAMEQQQKLKTIDPLVADRLASVIIKRQM